MNKEKLLKLSDTLRGIAEGAKWERYLSSEWIDAEPKYDPIVQIENGYKIRLKQPSDPAAELKAAHAAGKTIQFLSGGVAWRDCDGPPLYLSNLEYRIKPEPQKLPLCADDVKAGDEFLAPDGYRRQWQKISDNGIMFVWGCASWEELNSHGWKIRSIGETEWRPCYKLVEQ